MINQIFWQNNESKVLLNRRMLESDKSLIEEAVSEQKLDGVVWLKSSGTESSGAGHKMVCLSKKAILCAAQSVNDFYKVNSKDCWLNPLPLFHIGGLSIAARCFLSGASEVHFEKWQPEKFVQTIVDQSVTISSLVPTQVVDLVDAQLKCPASMRFILLGGGALDKNIFLKARELGWPLIPSYGMTETSALMAGATLESLNISEFPAAHILPHIEFTKVAEGQFSVQSSCLFTGFLWVSESAKTCWQERPEPFVLDDRLEIRGQILKVLGRNTELVKILGETVNLSVLSAKLKEKIRTSFLIVPVKNERRGFDLKIILEGEENKITLEELNQDLMPFETMDSLHYEKSFPKSELGKINRSFLFKKYQ